MLSRRERDVLEMTAKGVSAKCVGPSLGISPHTVIAHKESARGKLGALNITHAVALAIKLGLITGPEIAEERQPTQQPSDAESEALPVGLTAAIKAS
jgi:DNA-binding CsgD family transcriptional regulator